MMTYFRGLFITAIALVKLLLTVAFMIIEEGRRRKRFRRVFKNYYVLQNTRPYELLNAPRPQYAHGFRPLCNFELPQYGGDPYCPKCMAFWLRNERPQCEHGFFPYGDVPHCPKCLAENAQVK